jgi:hypothetical protein
MDPPPLPDGPGIHSSTRPSKIQGFPKPGGPDFGPPGSDFRGGWAQPGGESLESSMHSETLRYSGGQVMKRAI